ncbi:MAG TPA: hypothetical protein VH796_13675 [Nitrososphaeraceae archaeon]
MDGKTQKNERTGSDVHLAKQAKVGYSLESKTQKNERTGSGVHLAKQS